MTPGGPLLLWLGVAALGIYHGLNPAMGWPLAVANGLTERRDRAVLATLLPLAAGHFAAMAVVLAPFVALAWLVEWQRAVRLAAGALVLGFGVYRLVVRRHPRFLARVRPTQLAWWSFLMATAHGAGLMLLPLALGLCASAAPGDAASPLEAGHAGMRTLLQSDLATALQVALLHTLAMLAAGLVAAWLVYRYLGLQALRRAWFDLDLLWAASLVIAGAAGLASAL